MARGARDDSDGGGVGRDAQYYTRFEHVILHALTAAL